MKPYQTKHQRASLRLDMFPYAVKLSDNPYRSEHVEWLDQNMPNSYCVRWTFAGPGQINFADEQDKMLFVLRWA